MYGDWRDCSESELGGHRKTAYEEGQDAAAEGITDCWYEDEEMFSIDPKVERRRKSLAAAWWRGWNVYIQEEEE